MGPFGRGTFGRGTLGRGTFGRGMFGRGYKMVAVQKGRGTKRSRVVLVVHSFGRVYCV